MPYREHPLVPGHPYHVFNRGNNRQDVFLDRENYLLFLRLIRKYLVEPGSAHLLAYCLMPNHYHLFVRTKLDNGSRKMQALLLAVTKSFNNRYGRTGSLFQGRFKAVLVQREAHWSYLTAYIHLNPVKARLVAGPADWEFSSYRGYVGLRQGTLVDPAWGWDGTPAGYRRFVEGFDAGAEAQIAGVLLE